MLKTLEEIAHIFSGTDYKKNPPGDRIPIYGTGGLMGYTSIPLYSGPAVLSGRKGSINNPLYIEGPFWNVDTIFCIKTNPNVDTKWLYYNFLNTDLSQLNEATGVPSVNSKALYKLKFQWFDLPEQRRIAQILSTTDAVIEKTQIAIAKYKAIKQGLLHDLFTRGLDAAGCLRPTFREAPELYKASELGMIPKEWEVKRFGDYVNLIHGYQFRDFDFTENGIPVVKIGQIKPEDLDLSRCSFISKDRIDTFRSIIIRNDDVLMALTGATLGKACKVKNLKKEVLQNYRVGRFDPYDSNQIHKGFLYYTLTTQQFLNQVFSKVNAGAQGNIGKSDFEKPLFKMPSYNEQKCIVYRLESINQKLHIEDITLQKYQSIKRGLMGDLLGGGKYNVNNFEIKDNGRK